MPSRVYAAPGLRIVLLCKQKQEKSQTKRKKHNREEFPLEIWEDPWYIDHVLRENMVFIFGFYAMSTRYAATCGPPSAGAVFFYLEFCHFIF